MDEREKVLAEVEALIAAKGKGKVTTREQALANAMAVDAGLETPLISPDEILVGGIGAGTVGKGLKSLIAPLVEQSEWNAAVKSGKAGSKLLDMLSDAKRALGAKNTATESALQELLAGKSGVINPDRVAEVFPNYAKKLAERLPEGELRAEVGSSQLRRLLKGANKAAKYSKSDIETPASKAAVQSAEQLADIIRRQIYEVDGAKQLLKSEGQAIKQKSLLDKIARNPNQRIFGKEGSQRLEALKEIDQAIGSKLAPTGEKVRLAQQLADTSIRRPYELAVKTGEKAAYGLANLLDSAKAPEAVGAGIAYGSSKLLDSQLGDQIEKQRLLSEIDDLIRAKEIEASRGK